MSVTKKPLDFFQMNFKEKSLLKKSLFERPYQLVLKESLYNVSNYYKKRIQKYYMKA